MLLGHPVTDRPGLYHWHRHRHVQGLARLARRQGLRMERVRLPSRHDPRHPAGFLVLSYPQRPGFRADLGVERTFPPDADRPSDHLFLEITLTIHSRRGQVREICQTRWGRGEGLADLRDEVRKRLLSVCHPFHDDWWFSGTIR